MKHGWCPIHFGPCYYPREGWLVVFLGLLAVLVVVAVIAVLR